VVAEPGSVSDSPSESSSERREESSAQLEEKGISGKDLPGKGKEWTKLRGNQGWKDSNGDIWNKDKLHKDHWDISNSKGKKAREVDFEGNEIWPGGLKNKNKKP
jgi:hypothetical protein